MDNSITRRKFLLSGAACLGSTILIPGCGGSHDNHKNSSATGGDDDSAVTDDTFSDDTSDDDTGENFEKDIVAIGLFAAGSASSPENAVRLVCKSLDWSWLSHGDCVLVKVASNSGNPHPSVTSPAAVSALAAELFERGAGRVIVADQGGVSSVRSASGGMRHGSTRALMESNGLYEAVIGAGAEPYFFDEQDYEAGYFEASLPFSGSHWITKPKIPSIILDADHIIYLPRLSSHMIAGYTHGHKCAVGWLREDSRHELHFKAGSLHEKYVEVNYCEEIRSRFRLAITLAEKYLLDTGPDKGTIADADPWIVIASPHLPNHDAVSVALLAFIDDRTPASGDGLISPYGSHSDLNNRFFLRAVPVSTGIPWSSGVSGDYTTLNIHDYQSGIASDRALTRAYEILGGVPSSIGIRMIGNEPAQDLRDYLSSFGNGIFRITA
jgi:uncharacterized protein (DUF362 family)